ncbi:Scn11a [Symbiodinium sp. CCMP2456]|nr:Scn11a [Symbiodinium sp. CCMP2456]
MATFQDAVMSPRVQDVVETEKLEDWPIDGAHPEWKGFLQQQFSKQAALLQQLTLHLREETQAGIKLENKKLSQAVQEQFAKQAKLLQEAMMSASALLFVLLAGPGLAVRQNGRNEPELEVHEAQHETIEKEKIGDVAEGDYSEDTAYVLPMKPRRRPEARAEILMELQEEGPRDTCPRRSEVWSQTGRTLGQGVNGQVVEVTGSGHSGPYALKVPRTPEAKDDAELEVAVMNSASSQHCQNVMHLTAEKPCVKEGSDEKVNAKAYVAPKMAGDLHSWVLSASLRGRTFCAERIIKQVTDGMNCLHKAGYIHGDLNADNIFYKELDSEYCPSGVVLADFGLSRRINTWMHQYAENFYRGSYHLPSSLFVGHRDTLQIKSARDDKVYVTEEIDRCHGQNTIKLNRLLAVLTSFSRAMTRALYASSDGRGSAEMCLSDPGIQFSIGRGRHQEGPLAWLSLGTELASLQVPSWPSARPGEIALIADEQAELKTTQAAEEGTEPAQEGSPENARDNKPALHSWNSTWQHDDEHPEPQSKVQAVALTIVHSASFTYAITFLILVNMVILGIEVDVASTLPPYQEPRWFGLINLTIVVIFVAELVLKFVAYGCRGFIHGPERWWNFFDVLIISTSVMETIMEFVTIWMAAMQMDSSHLRVMRFARIARALRGVRAVRFLRFVSALRTLVFSILSTMWSLIWTLVLLILLFYCFAVILTQLVTDHCRYNEGGVVNCSPDLMRFWKSVAESMLTLFISISGGLSWSEALQPLRDVSEIAFLCMVVYIVLTVLAILNVVTGVFCNNAIESARADKDIAIMKQMQKHAKQLKSLRGVFKEIDNDQSNLVSLQELKDALKSKKLASFLESMDISTQDIWTLFMVMDSDGSGDVTLEEFVTGCMQLQGPAQSIQLARMRHENLKTRAEILRVGADIGNLKALFHELLRRQGELHL